MRRTISLIAFVLLLASGSAASAAAASEPLVVRDVTLGEFPRVGMQVSLPSEMLPRSGATPEFTVLENGRRVEVLDTSQPQLDPVDVVLVIDTSGSMAGRSMDAAKDAARAFVSDLESGSKVAVISFSDKPRLVSPLGQAQQSLMSSISGLKAEGETALYDALSLAAREVERAGVKRPVVVLLSDGGDTVSRTDLDTPLKALDKSGAPVLVVALPSAEADYHNLKLMARRTGGRFATVGSAEDLTAFYQGLARELQTTWNLTYLSNRPSTNDLDIELTAKVGSKKATGSQVVPNPLFVQQAPRGSALVLPAPPGNLVTLASALGLVFISIFALVASGLLLLAKPKTALDQVKYYDQLHATSDTDSADGQQGGVTATVLGAVDYVAGKRGIKRMAYEQLERAGLPLRPVEYITMHVSAVVLTGVLVQVLSGRLLLSVGAVILATVGPLAYLEHKIKERRTSFQTQLPDILNVIAGSLRAGWGLQQSLDLVIQQAAPPVSTEFARVETEVRLGRPIEESLASVAERMQSEDFAWAVTAIGIQREVGGNLAEVLDVVAATIRDRSALNRQIAALTAEGKLSAWVLVLLPFVIVVLLSIVNPGYLSKLYTTIPGLAMLGFGAVLLVAGVIWLRRVVEIEV